MKIKFYNTISRKKEKFKPLKEGAVGLYTCGPTVYDYAHIGNFRAYIFEDLLRRFLEFLNYNVLHIMNITDIDDKTIKNSIKQNMSLQDFTDKYTEAFYEDVEKLRILKADHYPRATDFIPQMIEMILALEKKGYTYTTQDGSVFFKISEFKSYGRLANLDPGQLMAGERVEADEYGKEEGRDFALWKGYKDEDGNVFWDSPWGKGRPGWHIECSAMSMNYLGNHFDIHCGGVDNIFPHHENEIAQSSAVSGSKFVNYWLHNEHLLIEGQKMSKSEGNFYTLRDLIDKNYSMEAIRYTLLSTHYRSKLNFTLEKVRIAQKGIDRLRELKRRLEKIALDSKNEGFDVESEKMISSFSDKLADDLNISGALGELFIWVNSLFLLLDNRAVSSDVARGSIAALLRIDLILNVLDLTDSDLSLDIASLIKQREQARLNRDWADADRIRKELDLKGVTLEDTPDGTVWKKRRV
jgi:cysteinyl-tRNA synthetase